MLTPEQEVEIAARELRKVAYHEAAHKVIGERFGGGGDVEIWRNDSDRIKDGESAWRGRCWHLFPWVANAHRKAAGIRQVRSPVYDREYICMAGMIAELILQGNDDQDKYASEADANWFIVEDLYAMIENGYASDSDLRGMGVGIRENGEIVGWRSRLVKTGIRMVREEWTKIVAEAERLIAEHSTEPAEAA